jgi:phosphatidylglycerol---prolipoprotein diacylglyceryl transferase
VFPLINVTPGAQVIPGVPIGWYGLGYVIALAVMLLVSQRAAERRGFAPSHVWNALLLVGVLALLGGRLYHVIDQWGPIYSQNPLSAILPPYSGLGLYGGVAGAALGILIYARWKHIPLRLGLDIVIPGTLLAQGIARWGNFFNQELYGPPTDAPWGITIDCAHRVAQYPCTTFPFETTGFHPLFFYESSLDIIGGLIALYISRRFLARLQPGDLAAFWGIWYGSIRAILETFREGWNWTLGGIATAQIVGATIVVIGIAWIAWNHRPGSKPYAYLPAYQPQPPPGPDVIQESDDGEYEVDDDEDEHEGDDAVRT